MVARTQRIVPTLNSWKEISEFLGKGVRTAQRYEQALDLPVYRLGDGPKSPVYAFPAELTAWVLRQSSDGNGQADHGRRRDLSRNALRTNTRVLVNRSSQLMQQMFRSITLQQRQSQKLCASFRALCSNLKRLNRRDPVAARMIRDQLRRIQEDFAAVTSESSRTQVSWRNHAEGD